ACPRCGPKAYLTTDQGQTIPHKDPIQEAGRLIEEGFVLAIKGYGGFHVATCTTKDPPIQKLRKAKHRAKKPFAIMSRDLKTIHTFAEVNSKEGEILSSLQKPIVLLDKSKDYYLSEQIAPGLHNVGVMLPYTGMHIMLFDEVAEPAFVMTSANSPSEPIVTQNREALEKLRSTVDYFLLHNREIAQRCDDSVVRLHNGKHCFIRRSRGYAPAPIHLHHSSSTSVLGVGAEENVTACIVVDDKAFVSQYIGDVENLETLTFLKEAIHHLLDLTNTKVDAVVCDLHPKFVTSTLAKNFAEDMNCAVYPVQHHHAHILSLMGEHGLEEMIGVACDGYGYGVDGKAWGGEILHCTRDRFARVGHLEEQPLVGGDLASQFPVRMATGILRNIDGIEEWLMSKSKHLPHGKEEAHIIIHQLHRADRIPTTSSCGRILDAVSAILNICHKRTYHGEPAIKLESMATKGQDLLKLEPEITGGVLRTTGLLEAVYDAKDVKSPADLACSVQSYLGKGLAQLAIEAAKDTGIRTIGFSGGVAYNKHITTTLMKRVREEGLEFFVHEAIPAGDGGISFGQAYKATFGIS
ncbi:carbamoyltransferase HypF, partial [Candidatus Bathyarchaeota archaeon]|nr:carbamoyltransferase HypF [Candidatus Bathyarchaeota archaeon]